MEKWKDIPNYKGVYQISDLGRVKSLNYKRQGSSKLLKPSTDTLGYRRVFLSKNGLQTNFLVHKLVWESFKGKYRGVEIDHIDDNPSNNTLDNLQLLTHRENIIKSFKTIKTKNNYTGARKSKSNQTSWFSSVSIKNKTIYLGTFTTELEAHQAYLQAIDKLVKHKKTILRKWSKLNSCSTDLRNILCSRRMRQRDIFFIEYIYKEDFLNIPNSNVELWIEFQSLRGY